MKKAAAIILAFSLLLVSAGCVSRAPAKGRYKVLSVNAEGPEQYFTAGHEGGILLPESYGGKADEFILLSLDGDGSARFTLFGETRTGSWSESGDSVTVELEDGEKLSLTRLRATACLMLVYGGAEVVLCHAE